MLEIDDDDDDDDDDDNDDYYFFVFFIPKELKHNWHQRGVNKP